MRHSFIVKYESEIVVNLPRKRFIELFNNTENMKKWQSTLEEFEHISGEPGKEGAKSKMIYKERGGTMEMIETITHANFPEAFHATYEASGVFNIQENFFYDEGDSTRWKAISEFQFSGIWKILSLFMRRAFRKQTLSFMEMFKEFAENE